MSGFRREMAVHLFVNLCTLRVSTLHLFETLLPSGCLVTRGWSVVPLLACGVSQWSSLARSFVVHPAGASVCAGLKIKVCLKCGCRIHSCWAS
uniref:Putative secreted protein n=1 Tax=Rhipicephalus microplus TaxID=6941 RepID=A0A6G5A1K7_RHIMP